MASMLRLLVLNDYYFSFHDLCQAMGCEMRPLDNDSDIVNNIKRMVEKTAGPTHTEYTLSVEDVFSVNRPGELQFLSVRCFCIVPRFDACNRRGNSRQVFLQSRKPTIAVARK